MDADQQPLVDEKRIRRRLKELDREVKMLFSTMPAGPELVSQWGALIRETRLLEDQVAAQTDPNRLSGKKARTAKFSPLNRCV